MIGAEFMDTRVHARDIRARACVCVFVCVYDVHTRTLYASLCVHVISVLCLFAD